MKKYVIFCPLFLAYSIFSITSCAPVISKQLRKQVAKELTLSEVLKDPETYKGKTVLWSGVIINSVNLKEGTMIEVLQKPPTCKESQRMWMSQMEGFWPYTPVTWM